MPRSHLRPVRRRGPFRACALALAFSLSPVAAVVPMGAAASGDTAWPESVQLVEARLVRPKPGDPLNLPQLRIYDAEGRRLLNATGYDRRAIPLIAAALDGKRQPDATHRLADQLALLRTPGGKPLPAPPAADLTLVKYWADWCVPCHTQSRDLRKLLAERTGLKVNLIHVDADFRKGRR